uniref:SFRICE_025817 n=1 Tax=Spodoptera frugiperda TaxID=7108 RepID=A0A2H1WCQ8_SPOFR
MDLMMVAIEVKTEMQRIMKMVPNIIIVRLRPTVRTQDIDLLSNRQ